MTPQDRDTRAKRISRDALRHSPPRLSDQQVGRLRAEWDRLNARPPDDLRAWRVELRRRDRRSVRLDRALILVAIAAPVVAIALAYRAGWLS